MLNQVWKYCCFCQSLSHQWLDIDKDYRCVKLRAISVLCGTKCEQISVLSTDLFLRNKKNKKLVSKFTKNLSIPNESNQVALIKQSL